MHTFAFRHSSNPPSWTPMVPTRWHVALVVGVLAGLALGGLR